MWRFHRKPRLSKLWDLFDIASRISRLKRELGAEWIQIERRTGGRKSLDVDLFVEFDVTV